MADNLRTIPRKCKCDDDTQKLILVMTSPQIELMDPGEECESKHLFPGDFWKPLSHEEQNELGKCIVCLVAQGLLHLENLGASPKYENHVVYRKI